MASATDWTEDYGKYTADPAFILTGAYKNQKSSRKRRKIKQQQKYEADMAAQAAYQKTWGPQPDTPDARVSDFWAINRFMDSAAPAQASAYQNLLDVLDMEGFNDQRLLNLQLEQMGRAGESDVQALQEEQARLGYTGSGVGSALQAATMQGTRGQQATRLAQEAQLQEERRVRDAQLKSEVSNMLLEQIYGAGFQMYDQNLQTYLGRKALEHEDRAFRQQRRVNTRAGVAQTIESIGSIAGAFA